MSNKFLFVFATLSLFVSCNTEEFVIRKARQFSNQDNTYTRVLRTYLRCNLSLPKDIEDLRSFAASFQSCYGDYCFNKYEPTPYFVQDDSCHFVEAPCPYSNRLSNETRDFMRELMKRKTVHLVNKSDTCFIYCTRYRYGGLYSISPTVWRDSYIYNFFFSGTVAIKSFWNMPIQTYRKISQSG